MTASLYNDSNALFVSPEISVHVYIVLVVVNLCVVLATKALIFQWIFTRRPLSPMDFLILLDELEKVFGFVYLSTIVLSNFDMLNEPTMIQPWEVWERSVNSCVTKVIGVGFVVQMFVGGLGISVMRFIYINCADLIQFHGERRVALIISAMTHTIELIALILLQQNSYSKIRLGCEDAPHIINLNFNPKYLIPLVMIVAMVEFAIYISISVTVYNQNKFMKEFISQSNFAKRRRESAINFTGHFVHFLMEICMACLAALPLKFRFKYIFGFGPISVATVIFSTPLRKQFFVCCQNFKDKCYEIKSRFVTLSPFPKPSESQKATPR